MLEYEWGNPASILLSGEETAQDGGQTHQTFDPFNQTLTGNIVSSTVAFPSHHHLFHQQQQLQHNHNLFDSRAIALSQSRPTVPPSPSLAGFSQHAPLQLVGSKTEEFSGNTSDFPARIGLNLGVRTYFSSADDDFVSRLYRRSRAIEPVNPPRCQAEGCNADLTQAKHYHRRHKVCEFHSKASTVIAAGLTQRFCQQCSRFHLLSEFDQGKRSCRKRLADHNRRRRKSQSQQQQPQSGNHTTSLAPEETPSRSSPESGTRSSSSVSPRITLDCFLPTHSGSASSNSGFSPTKENYRPHGHQTMDRLGQ